MLPRSMVRHAAADVPIGTETVKFHKLCKKKKRKKESGQAKHSEIVHQHSTTALMLPEMLDLRKYAKMKGDKSTGLFKFSIC